MLERGTKVDGTLDSSKGGLFIAPNIKKKLLFRISEPLSDRIFMYSTCADKILHAHTISLRKQTTNLFNKGLSDRKVNGAILVLETRVALNRDAVLSFITFQT